MSLLDGIFFTPYWLNGELVSDVPRALELIGEGITYDDDTGRATFDLSALAGGGAVSASKHETANNTATYTLVTASATAIWEVRLSMMGPATGSGQLAVVIKKNGSEVFGGTVRGESESGEITGQLDIKPVRLAASDVLTIEVTADGGFTGGYTADWAVVATKMSAAA